jgi:hypothetical protein
VPFRKLSLPAYLKFPFSLPLTSLGHSTLQEGKGVQISALENFIRVLTSEYIGFQIHKRKLYSVICYFLGGILWEFKAIGPASLFILLVSLGLMFLLLALTLHLYAFNISP